MDEEKKEGGKKSGGKKFLNETARDFFMGCVALMPLALFIALFFYLLLFFESVGSVIFGITQSRGSTAAIGVFLVLATIYIGRKLRRRERSLLSLFEQFVILKIPVIGGWYNVVRDIIQTFTSGGGRNYLGTAKIPAAGGYIIGFVTSREEIPGGSVQLSVFVPTSPNPTTGLVFFIPEENVEYIDLSPENAFTKLISLGVK